MAHFNAKTGQCNPGRSRLGTLAYGVDEKQIGRAVRDLVAMGLFEMTSYQGRGKTADYTPAWQLFADFADDLSGALRRGYWLPTWGRKGGTDGPYSRWQKGDSAAPVYGHGKGGNGVHKRGRSGARKGGTIVPQTNKRSPEEPLARERARSDGDPARQGERLDGSPSAEPVTGEQWKRLQDTLAGAARGKRMVAAGGWRDRADPPEEAERLLARQQWTADLEARAEWPAIAEVAGFLTPRRKEEADAFELRHAGDGAAFVLSEWVAETAG
ncbi:MAG: hypothetical protein AB7J19_03635 [Beijerinckiaceae bacterium]